MFCAYCGKEIKDNEKFCAFCGAKINDGESSEEDSEMKGNIISNDESIGKEYSFYSRHGVRVGYLNRNNNYVEFKKDGIAITTDPKRKNIFPFISYNDIIAVKSEKYCYRFNIVMTVLSIIASILALLSGLDAWLAGLVLAAFCAFKIPGAIAVIETRMGKNVVLYTKSIKMADEFKQDLESVINNRK